MNFLFIVFAMLIGMAIAAQPSINQASARILGAPVSAAVVSTMITTTMVLGLLLVTGPRIEAAALARLPWWFVLGGAAGAVIVLGGLAIIPVTGAATFFVCIVLGQLLGAALIDHVGAFGMPIRPMNSLRLFGIAAVVLGVGFTIAGTQPR